LVPVTNACFISYRHAGPASEIVRRLCGTLAEQLALLSANYPIYIDEKRLKPGDYLDAELASQMCRSTCMVLLFTPEYFDIEHPYCAREYQGMRRLETARRQLLPAEYQTKDLVIPVVVRGESRVPDELRPTLCASLDDVLLSATDVKTKRVVKRVRKVADAVFERIDAMRHAKSDFAQDCGKFTFPTAAEIEPWLRNVAPPPLRSPIQAAP
jgi:hypothetical protein